MQSIEPAFTRAAGGKTAGPGVSVFWLMVLAIAILDDGDRREADRRKKRRPPQPLGKPVRPNPPAGPRPS